MTENGGITYRNEDIDEPERLDAKDKVYEVVRATAEYMRQMETAPFLKADGLEDGYCCTDTLQGGFELSYDQEKTIQDVSRSRSVCLTLWSVSSSRTQNRHRNRQCNESNEYFYQFNETTGACEGKVTGLIEFDGARYYAINGVAKSGWWNLTDADGENSYYYFDKETFKGLNGPSRAFFENVTYTFDNGKLLKGEWLTTDQGTKYYYGPTFVQEKWYTVEGEKYYFDPQGYRYTGLRYADGRMTDAPIPTPEPDPELKNGIINEDGELYYYVNGVKTYAGLIQIDGDYYYVNGPLLLR